MTLVIAWRADKRLHVASDSRIKFAENSFADVGVKVISLPVCVIDTDPEGSVIFRQTYGFAYAGSFVNAGTFAELIAELLQTVQFVGDHASLSFNTICEFLVRYCGKISQEVCERMYENGRYEFILLGYCPQEKCLRSANFKFTQDAGTTHVSYDQILTGANEWIAIGRGAKLAEETIAKSGGSPLLVLNEIIDQKQEPTVGGDIQYGSFDKSGNFTVHGITRVTTEQVVHQGQTYGPVEQRIHRYRGFQMYDSWDPGQEPLWVTPGFVELHVPSNAASANYFRHTLGLPPE